VNSMDVWNLPVDIVFMLVFVILILGVIALLWQLRTTRVHERLDEVG
jgi:hypothetical protein